MNIAASGGSSIITCSAVRTRNYTWNGVGTTYTETENGSPTLSKSGDGTLSGTTSGSKLTCTLSSVSTPSNNVSVSNSNNIINVTANTTTSSFTILCQFTMTSNSTVFNVRVLIEP